MAASTSLARAAHAGGVAPSPPTVTSRTAAHQIERFTSIGGPPPRQAAHPLSTVRATVAHRPGGCQRRGRFGPLRLRNRPRSSNHGRPTIAHCIAAGRVAARSGGFALVATGRAVLPLARRARQGFGAGDHGGTM